MDDMPLIQKMVDLKEHDSLDLVKKELESGVASITILGAMREAMSRIGELYQEGKYFLPELIMASEIFKEAFQILQPTLNKENEQIKGKVVFGTVEGDIHDIGKDIVVSMLRGIGYQVHDLGVDVPPEKFIEKLKETGAPLLCLSGLITTAYDSMKETIEAVEKEGLRDNVKVLIGGGVMNQSVQNHTGADAFGRDPIEAIELCRKYIGGK